MIIEVDRDELLNVLLLIEKNNHLSASRSGLEERSRNREEAIKKLLLILEMTEEKLEELYYADIGEVK